MRNGKAFVAAILSLTGTLIFCAIDFELFRAHNVAPTLKVGGCASFIFAAFITHVLEGAYGVHGFRVYQPMVGGTTFVALQSCAWCVFAIFLNLALAIPVVPGSRMPFGYLCLTALVGFISHFFLQASIPQFDGSKRAFKQGKWSSYTIVALVSAVFALIFLLIIGSGRHVLGLQQYLWTFLLSENVSVASDDFTLHDVNTSTNVTPFPYRSVAIGNIVLFSCAPYVQVCGWLQKQDFTLTPSTGGATFLLFQAFGWALYLLAFLMLPLYSFLPLQDAVLSVAPIAFASQCLVVVSLQQFNNQVDQTHSGMLSGRLARFDSHRTLSLILAIMACVLLVSLDVLDLFEYPQVRYLIGTHMSIFRIVLVLSIGCNLSAGFLVQLSGMNTYDSYQIIQPFRGGVRFVARQAIGWTIYAVSMLATVVLAVTPEDSLPNNGLCSMTGVFCLVGMVLLLISVSFFEESFNPPIRLQVSYLVISFTTLSTSSRRLIQYDTLYDLENFHSLFIYLALMCR